MGYMRPKVYHSLISSFYHNSSLALLVYAMDEKNSFIHLDSWLNEISTHRNPNINIFLIGNKVDLEDRRIISRELAQEFLEKNNAKLFLETMAKTGFNAQNVFVEATKLLYEQHLQFKDKISMAYTFGNIVEDEPNKNIVMEEIEEEAHKSRKKDVVNINKTL